MIEPVDGILSLAPFVARRTIAFDDCDPAGVMFAGRYNVHAIWAYRLYLDRRLGGAHGVITPVKAVSLVHRSPLRPDERLDLGIAGARVGRTTFSVSIAGLSGDVPAFDATLTLICTPPGIWRSCPVPAALRAKLLNDGAVDAPHSLEEEV